MNTISRGTARIILACIVAMHTGIAVSAEQEEYARRAAERDASLFRTLDRDGDGFVTRDEARGDLNFQPRFDDIDINRDGIVTSVEMEIYLQRQYGSQGPALAKPAAR